MNIPEMLQKLSKEVGLEAVSKYLVEFAMQSGKKAGEAEGEATKRRAERADRLRVRVLALLRQMPDRTAARRILRYHDWLIDHGEPGEEDRFSDFLAQMYDCADDEEERIEAFTWLGHLSMKEIRQRFILADAETTPTWMLALKRAIRTAIEKTPGALRELDRIAAEEIRQATQKGRLHLERVRRERWNHAPQRRIPRHRRNRRRRTLNPTWLVVGLLVLITILCFL